MNQDRQQLTLVEQAVAHMDALKERAQADAARITSITQALRDVIAAESRRQTASQHLRDALSHGQARSSHRVDAIDDSDDETSPSARYQPANAFERRDDREGDHAFRRRRREETPPETIVCKRCAERKSVECFGYASKTIDGEPRKYRRGVCRKCNRVGKNAMRRDDIRRDSQ